MEAKTEIMANPTGSPLSVNLATPPSQDLDELRVCTPTIGLHSSYDKSFQLDSTALANPEGDAQQPVQVGIDEYFELIGLGRNKLLPPSYELAFFSNDASTSAGLTGTQQGNSGDGSSGNNRSDSAGNGGSGTGDGSSGKNCIHSSEEEGSGEGRVLDQNAQTSSSETHPPSIPSHTGSINSSSSASSSSNESVFQTTKLSILAPEVDCSMMSAIGPTTGEDGIERPSILNWMSPKDDKTPSPGSSPNPVFISCHQREQELVHQYVLMVQRNECQLKEHGLNTSGRHLEEHMEQECPVLKPVLTEEDRHRLAVKKESPN